MCYFSRLEHIAHYKATNQSTVKSNLPTFSHRVSRRLKSSDFKDDLKDVSVFDDLNLQGNLFQTDGAA